MKCVHLHGPCARTGHPGRTWIVSPDRIPETPQTENRNRHLGGCFIPGTDYRGRGSESRTQDGYADPVSEPIAKTGNPDRQHGPRRGSAFLRIGYPDRKHGPETRAGARTGKPDRISAPGYYVRGPCARFVRTGRSDQTLRRVTGPSAWTLCLDRVAGWAAVSQVCPFSFLVSSSPFRFYSPVDSLARDVFFIASSAQARPLPTNPAYSQIVVCACSRRCPQQSCKGSLSIFA